MSETSDPFDLMICAAMEPVFEMHAEEKSELTSRIQALELALAKTKTDLTRTLDDACEDKKKFDEQNYKSFCRITELELALATAVALLDKLTSELAEANRKVAGLERIIADRRESQYDF